SERRPPIRLPYLSRLLLERRQIRGRKIDEDPLLISRHPIDRMHARTLDIRRNANDGHVFRFVLEKMRQGVSRIIVVIVVVIRVSILARLCPRLGRSRWILAGLATNAA